MSTSIKLPQGQSDSPFHADLMVTEGKPRGTGRVATLFALVLLCVACAAVNITKAVHIDDTAYLLIARNILVDPLHPMSSSLLWEETSEPVFRINQPVLMCYVYALIMAIFGESELALHAVMALVTSVAIVTFYSLAKRIVARHALFLTSLFALGPAFLPGQNLMFDVPLVALWLIFFWGLFAARESSKGSYYLVAAVAVAAACLVKYTSLVLLPVLAYVVWRRRQRAQLWVLAVPLLVLATWSMFNYWDYGGIHMLERSGASRRAIGPIGRSVLWMAGLGAVTPFTPFFWRLSPILTPVRCRLLGIAAGMGLVIGLLALLLKSPSYVAPFWAVFTANGALCLAVTLLFGLDMLATAARDGDAERFDQGIALLLWLAGAMLFIVFLAPFMAVRHILPAVPPLLLLLGRGLPKIRGATKAVILTITAVLGFGLAVSDYAYADMYSRAPELVAQRVPRGAKIWLTGHWGWQWYAEKAGFESYDPQRSQPATGDFIVIPAIVSRQEIRPEHKARLRKMDEIAVPAGATTFLRTMSFHPGGGYYFFPYLASGPPWRFSREPLETFVIFRVADTAEAGGQEVKPVTR